MYTKTRIAMCIHCIVALTTKLQTLHALASEVDLGLVIVLLPAKHQIVMRVEIDILFN